MYPHFVEIHPKNCETQSGWTDSGVLVNVDHIIEIGEQYVNTTDDLYCVHETYDELKELIRSAGCHIEKGDPRLDQTKPLTMDELKDMVGQPVWDSNTDTWLLVYEGDWTYTPDPDRVCVRVVNRYGCNKIWLSEKDLIAKPLYRMKRCKDD